MTDPNNSRVQRILATIDSIPPGNVATYGQVAEEAGLPGRARMVGRILREAGAKDLPWHRVLGAGGVIRLDNAGATEQAKRLSAEGVCVRKGRVDLKRHGWSAV